jgi:hypothetical protein
LVVQAVDPGWLPLPGVEVRIAPRGGKNVESVAHTSMDGYATFWLDSDVEYTIEVGSVGFKTKRMKSIRFPKVSEPSPTAYIQFQLELSGPFVTVE